MRAMKKILIGTVIGLMLFSVSGCGEQEKQTNAPVATAAKVEVKQTVDAVGTVNVGDVRDIIIDFPAMVEKIHIKDGQRVKSGDLLFTLDLAQFNKEISDKEREIASIRQHQMGSAKSELSQSQLAINILKSDLAKKQSNFKNDTDPEIKKLLNDLKNVQDVYDRAQKDLASKKKLLESGVISQSDYDDFSRSVDAQEKAVESAKLNLEIARYAKKQEIEKLQSEIQQKELQASNTSSIKLLEDKAVGLEMDIKLMKDKLNKSYIKGKDVISDVQNGVVSELGYVQGSIVNSSTKLLSIMDLGSMVIKADVAEEFIKDIKPGADVVIVPVADKSKEYKGKVVKIMEKAVQKNGETIVPVEISVDNKDGFLFPNFNVDVKISIGKK